MTSTETFTAPNGQARQATEKTADVIKQGVHQATERAGDLMAQLPKVDLNEGVTRYYEFVQQTVDLQRDLATKWAELLTSMSGSLREQAESFIRAVAGTIPVGLNSSGCFGERRPPRRSERR